MANVYTGAGHVTSEDFRYAKWVGRTKSGKAVQIELEKAFCRSNPDWKFEEKNDTVAAIELEGAYDDIDLPFLGDLQDLCMGRGGSGDDDGLVVSLGGAAGKQAQRQDQTQGDSNDLLHILFSFLIAFEMWSVSITQPLVAGCG